ncbi:hypothetical protein ABES80_16625 [Bacillus gobiensis]|uniref:hypothetical protein n=1 Tax=Bacillus gobiensis TaxID=1441095 RepID=UPI003D198582
MKKSKMVVVAFAVALLVPSSTFASSTFAAGEWDYLGSDVFTNQSKNFKSGGGDFAICLSADSKSSYYQLFEEDPFNPDDKVGSGLYFKTAGSNDFDAEGCHIFRDIGGFVDGTDDQAEFYLAKYSSGNSSVRAWD